jgi:hypothetical protein
MKRIEIAKIYSQDYRRSFIRTALKKGSEKSFGIDYSYRETFV